MPSSFFTAEEAVNSWRQKSGNFIFHMFDHLTTEKKSDFNGMYLI